jgi:hypothetical protein
MDWIIKQEVSTDGCSGTSLARKAGYCNPDENTVGSENRSSVPHKHTMTSHTSESRGIEDRYDGREGYV